jgi:hypothetical protein
MSLMIDLEAQTAERLKVFWEKYEYLEQFLRLLSPTLKRTHQRLSKNPNGPIRKRESLAQESRECRALIETQKSLLAQIRNETQQLLNIYGGFGLCFPVLDESKVAKDFDLKIEEVKIFLGQLLETISLEVSDKALHSRIFGKLASIIQANCLVNNWGRNDEAAEANDIENSVLDR